MKRVVVLGRGGAGKTTFARRLGEVTGLPLIQLDEEFWQPGPHPPSPAQWAATQSTLTDRPAWIMDGDFGPHDVLDVRLAAADTVILLDYSLVRCAWQAARRSRERSDFWRWVWGYRRQHRPGVLRAIAAHAPLARVHVLRSPRAAWRLLKNASEEA